MDAPFDVTVLTQADVPVRMEARRGDALVATAVVLDGDRRRAHVHVHTPFLAREEAAAVVAAVAALADRSPITLCTNDLLLRYEARCAGFAGGLRQPLRSGAAEGAVGAHAPAGSRPDWLGHLVETMVPSVTVVARSTRSITRRATSGMPSLIDLGVRIAGVGRLTVVCPDVDDLIPESIACAIDTVAEIRRRFPIATGAIETVSFDQSSHGFNVSKHAGTAHRNLPLIHLNASLAHAEGLVTLARRRLARQSKRPPATAAPPATYVDAVTAHECWHQMEGAWEARSYRSTVEFRRRLGEHFGVATLEHAILGGTEAEPPAWPAAHAALTTQVSGYAGASRYEATAEMFKLWWCSPADSWSPAVRRFGRLIEDLLPS